MGDIPNWVILLAILFLVVGMAVLLFRGYGR